MKYAYFANAGRLAVNTGGEIWVYDTLDHQIGGFSQQQGSGGSISFGSQYGTIDLSRLPVVSRNGQPVTASPEPASAPGQATHAQLTSGQPATESDIFAAIERLGDLRAKGILSDEEFAAKKTELLSRL